MNEDWLSKTRAEYWKIYNFSALEISIDFWTFTIFSHFLVIFQSFFSHSRLTYLFWLLLPEKKIIKISYEFNLLKYKILYFLLVFWLMRLNAFHSFAEKSREMNFCAIFFLKNIKGNGTDNLKDFPKKCPWRQISIQHSVVVRYYEKRVFFMGQFNQCSHSKCFESRHVYNNKFKSFFA